MTVQTARSGYAPVNGLQLYYEIHGAGRPLIVLHGGLGSTELFVPNLAQLASERQVIAVDLQAHGRTADIDRPLSFEALADDVAALVEHLGLTAIDVLGYSFGGATALQMAMRHPARVRRLVLISVAFRRTGWYPDVLTAMGQMGPQVAEMMKPSPLYQTYARIAPRPEDFAILLKKMGDLLRRDYDWSAGVSAVPMPVLVVAADADSMPPSHIAEFYGLLGGGQRDAGWDGAARPASQLAILPGATHYNVAEAPTLVPIVAAFLRG